MVGYGAYSGMQMKTTIVFGEISTFLHFNTFENEFPDGWKRLWTFILEDREMFAGHMAGCDSDQWRVQCLLSSWSAPTLFQQLFVWPWDGWSAQVTGHGQLIYKDSWPDAGQELGVKTIIEFSYWTCRSGRMIEWLVCERTSRQSRHFISTGNILIKRSKKIKVFPQTWISRVTTSPSSERLSINMTAFRGIKKTVFK